MKDFRELLEVAKENKIPLSDEEFWFRIFKKIKIGNFEVSIQASRSHYCDPQETLKDLKIYEEWELALFENDEWVYPNNNEENNRFSDMPGLDYFDRVAAYVPTEIVQEICNYLENKDV